MNKKIEDMTPEELLEHKALLEKTLGIEKAKKTLCPECDVSFPFADNADASGDFAVCPECGAKVNPDGTLKEKGVKEKAKKPSTVICGVCSKGLTYAETKADADGLVECGCGAKVGADGKPGAKKKEMDSDEIVTKGMEETDNEIRFRVADPEGFDKFRRFALQKKKPQVFAIYGHVKDGGADEWEIQALRFPKPDWTMDTAKQWVKDNPDAAKAAMKTLAKGVVFPFADLITKGVDLDGHVSAADITNALQAFICEKADANGNGIAAPWKEGKPYAYVSDIYPFNYPNGTVVFSVMDKEGTKTYQGAYTYNGEGDTTVTDVVEIKQTWTKKSLAEAYDVIKDYFPDDTSELEDRLRVAVKRYEAQEDQIEDLTEEVARLKEVETEHLVLKEGRVLSDKNKKLVQTCIEALTALMAATEIVPKGVIVDDDILQGIDADLIKKTIKEAVGSGGISADLIAQSVEKAMARYTGKAVGAP